MPTAPKKPCNSAGCGVLVDSSESYCDKHRKERYKWSHTKSTTQRGYGAAWRKIRSNVFKRDSKLCQVCLKAGRVTEATEVDHIVSKANGGDDSIQNLQSICKSCHQRKTSREDKTGRGG